MCSLLLYIGVADTVFIPCSVPVRQSIILTRLESRALKLVIIQHNVKLASKGMSSTSTHLSIDQANGTSTLPALANGCRNKTELSPRLSPTVVTPPATNRPGPAYGCCAGCGGPCPNIAAMPTRRQCVGPHPGCHGGTRRCIGAREHTVEPAGQYHNGVRVCVGGGTTLLASLRQPA